MKLLQYLHQNRSLIGFTFLNLADKAFVFLTPFIVLTFFDARSQYVQLEYIISTVNIFATVTDFGMSGYMFFLYQSAKDKISAIALSRSVSNIIFIFLLLACLLLLLADTFASESHPLLWYILSRLLFIYLSVYFTSYFRLTDKPAYSIYITLSVNILTLLLIFVFYILQAEFALWIIFLPQLLLVAGFLVKVIFDFDRKNFSLRETLKVILASLKFSWPSMVQVFLMMYMANYGKINALDLLTNQEAVFLGYTLRFCMVMQLAHASLIGFYSKAILAGEDKYVISRKIFKLYFSVLLVTGIFVSSGLLIVQNYFRAEAASATSSMLIVLFALYTLMWCFYSYLEMYYARINKNRIKLYITFLILLVFVLSLQLLPFNLLQNIAYAMFFSILVGLSANIFVLKKLKFNFT